jgi:hypothetical protein
MTSLQIVAIVVVCFLKASLIAYALLVSNDSPIPTSVCAVIVRALLAISMLLALLTPFFLLQD